MEMAGGAAPLDAILESCERAGMDPGCVGFVAYDTCGLESPVRNCAAGEALFMGVMMTFLGINVSDPVVSQSIRDSLRLRMLAPETATRGSNTATPPLMLLQESSMKRSLKAAFQALQGGTREEKLQRMRRGRGFMTDIMEGRVGTDVFRDQALESLRRAWGGTGGSLAQTQGWDSVRFPIVFHLQWDAELSKTGKPRMLFHTSFEPWRMAVALAMALCGPSPPIQVRETPYRDPKSLHRYQAPRKYIIDWDLYVEENLGKAGPLTDFTEDRLLDMFVRSLAVIHAYMRRAGVLPSGKRLCMSIKSRTRRAKNKAGREDTKCSYHATVHVMEPASRHRQVITKVLEMVRRDKPSAYRAMVEKDGLQRGIHSPGRLAELGDYAGFMAMDTAMTSNWHQPVQSIGSSKGDGIVFKHRALVVFRSLSREGLIPIDPARDYDIHLADADGFPDRFPLRMAMLLAQHSASIPDPYSITYTPTSKWSPDLFRGLHAALSSNSPGVDALLGISMGGRVKRRRSCCDSPSTVASTASTVAFADGLAPQDVVPDWVMRGFANALHRVSMGSETFSANNFMQQPANGDARGVPEIASIRGYEGDSFAVKRAPCIVQAALDGVVAAHKKNCSYIWLARRAKASATGDRLVYMKCWDPDCQSRVRESRRSGGTGFDGSGWALLDRPNMRVIDPTTV